MALPTTNHQNFAEKNLDWLTKIADFSVPSVSSQTGSLVTANSFGAPLAVYGTGRAGLFITFTGTAVAHLQCSPSTATSPSTWYDLSSYTAGQVVLLDLGFACSLRVGIKTGKYTSGTVAWVLKTGGRP